MFQTLCLQKLSQQTSSHLCRFDFSSRNDIYLLLTEFEGRTVSYGPGFSLLDLWPEREGARATKSKEKKKRIRNLQYGPRKRG